MNNRDFNAQQRLYDHRESPDFDAYNNSKPELPNLDTEIDTINYALSQARFEIKLLRKLYLQQYSIPSIDTVLEDIAKGEMALKMLEEKLNAR